MPDPTCPKCGSTVNLLDKPINGNTGKFVVVYCGKCGHIHGVLKG